MPVITRGSAHLPRQLKGHAEAIIDNLSALESSHQGTSTLAILGRSIRRIKLLQIEALEMTWNATERLLRESNVPRTDSNSFVETWIQQLPTSDDARPLGTCLAIELATGAIHTESISRVLQRLDPSISEPRFAFQNSLDDLDEIDAAALLAQCDVLRTHSEWVGQRTKPRLQHRARGTIIKVRPTAARVTRGPSIKPSRPDRKRDD
ncbi:MAG: hypothetical protein ABIT01_06835 [Thermoanaerobaculia bacterium]